MQNAISTSLTYAFEAQVIATVTQVENIYWDLVGAYEDEQIKQRSLDFANQTLTDDQKQLELKAIPAMQVMTDQSAVATAEGNLTVARATLRLNELLLRMRSPRSTTRRSTKCPSSLSISRALPTPTLRKPIDELIAAAEKNRPDVAMDQTACKSPRRT